MNEPAHELLREIEQLYPTFQDDGLTWSDFVEQFTYLLVLKWGAERAQLSEPPAFDESVDWAALAAKEGAALGLQFTATLESAAATRGVLAVIYRGAVNKITKPAKLTQLVEFVDSKTWSALPVGVRGSAYDEMLRREAAETQSPNFTPRPLISALVEVTRPTANARVGDPACATARFLIAARDWIAENHHLDRDEKQALRESNLRGADVSDARACRGAVNALLHGVGPPSLVGDPVIVAADSLLAEPAEKFDLVLTNPTFGRADDVPPARGDFWKETSNKQLSFIQHVRSMLHIGGAAVLLVPDNVLFEGGAGETIRRRLLDDCDVHTLLRLPSGIFFKAGVKVNALFFERRAASGQPATKRLWVYDFRTGQRFTPKQRPLRRADLDDFVEQYRPQARNDREESDRFKCWTYEELDAREGFNLDVWASVVDQSLADPSMLPAPSVIAREILEHLAAAYDGFQDVACDLETDAGLSEPPDSP